MKLVSYNIQFGRGKDERFDLERIAGEVAGADLIAFQEVERFWTRSGLVDQPRELSRLLEDYHWVYGPGVDLDASYRDENGKLVRRRRQFGNMLMSRAPIIQCRVHLLPKFGSVGRPMSLQRCAVEGVIAFSNMTLRVYSVHLTHLASETRLPQIEALLAMHKRAEEEGPAMNTIGPEDEWGRDGLPPPMPRHAILLGDFNFEPNAREYDRIVGPMSPYGGRVNNPSGFVDAWVAAGHDESEGVTADIKGRPVRLDYGFVSTALSDRIRGCRIDEKAQGSDHQPFWLEMDI